MNSAWQRLRTWLILRRCERVGEQVSVLGRVVIAGQGRVCVGNGVVLDGRDAPIELHALPGAEIRLGDRVHLCGGVSVEARERVTLGQDVFVDGFSKIMDNHFHPLHGDRHVPPASAPVTIDDGARLGWRVTVLPGATVKAGVRVASGSVIRGNTRPAATERHVT